MPADGRKSIAVPEPTYEHFLQVHKEIRPNQRTPYWQTLNVLIEQYEQQNENSS